MTNFFFLDQNNQKQGPVSEQQLKVLAAQKVIHPNTPMETDTGHKGTAGQIRGLFPAAPPSPPAVPSTVSPTPQSLPVAGSTVEATNGAKAESVTPAQVLWVILGIIFISCVTIMGMAPWLLALLFGIGGIFALYLVACRAVAFCRNKGIGTMVSTINFCKTKAGIATIIVVLILCWQVFIGNGISLGGGTTISAVELGKLYTENVFAADAAYTRKTITVRGTVEDVDKTILAETGGTVAHPSVMFQGSVVICVFPPGTEASVSKLRKGQKVSIKGFCRGREVGLVVLTRCSIVKP